MYQNIFAITQERKVQRTHGWSWLKIIDKVKSLE